jgi:hypothetical protein
LDRKASVEEGRDYYKRLTDYRRWLLEPSSSCVYCDSRVDVAEAQGQFGNPEEGERSPLEAVTRGLVKIQQTEKTQCVL